MGKDYYTDLGLTRSASDVDLRKAYRKLSLKYHPDKDESAQAAKVFAAVAEAYDVLSEAKCKGFYDLYGEEGLKRGVTDGKGGRRGGFYAFEKAPTGVFSAFFGTDNPYKALNELAEAFEALTATPKFKAGKAMRSELSATLEEVLHPTSDLRGHRQSLPGPQARWTKTVQAPVWLGGFTSGSAVESCRA